MKKQTKQLALLLALTLMIICVCALVAGCGETPDPILTLDSTTTESTIATDNSSETRVTETTTQSTFTSSETTSETTSTTMPKYTTDDETGIYVNPLSGLKNLDSDPSKLRPVAIVVDNIKEAYANQEGLDQADIVYELLVAPGITRYLAVFQDYSKLDTVCNVRSGRDYHISLSLGHNAVLVCHGGAQNSTYDFFQLAADKLGSRWGFVDTAWDTKVFCKENVSLFQKSSSRPELGYKDTFIKSNVLRLVFKGSSKFLSEGGTITGAPVGFSFSSSDNVNVENGEKATNINVLFTCTGASGKKFVSFNYDATSKKYIRYQDNKTSDCGEILAFKNVLILGTEVTNVKGTKEDPNVSLVKTTGSGVGYYFTNGKAVRIEWRKATDRDVLSFYYYGTNVEVELSRGQSYVGFVNESYVENSFFG